MESLLYYLPFFVMNVSLMVVLIRWRGFLSFEGLGISCLLALVSIDGISLFIVFLSQSDDNVSKIILERIIPTVVHIVGLLSLIFGMLVIDPKPVPISRHFNVTEKYIITKIAWILAIVGFSMKIFSLVSMGITDVQSYFLGMSDYVIAQRKFGGFLDEGLSISVFGLGIVAANKDTIMKQSVLLFIMGLLVFFLSHSRGGVLSIFLIFFLLLFLFNKRLLKKWFNPILIIFISLIIVLTSGIKSQFRANPENIDTSFVGMGKWGINRFVDRFSEEGLYDGYANFVNRLYEDETKFKRGEVLEYTLTSWIPYIFYKEKPQHPMRAIGDLVYRDRSVSLEDVSAVTLIGTTFYDFGIISVIIYTFIYGIFLGLLRILTAASKVNVFIIVWYLHIIFIDGFTNIIHGGILNFPGTIALATGSMGVVFIINFVLGKVNYYGHLFLRQRWVST